ncbi:MAG: electron transfer flavoprotein subunit beta/FixA family protein [Anaerolineales bacterium]|nr:electron transfer flavoprotein subunit beta/FixA family protein [Anaerolineales bacterium]
MNIVVAIKQVPNLTDELELNADATGLDLAALTYVLNEFDEQALEEAALTKETAGGSVTVIGVDTTGELDSALHTALAKGADKAVKITGDFDGGADSRTQARLLAGALSALAPDLVLTGVQAADDRAGQIGPMLAAHLGWPYVGVVTSVLAGAGQVKVHKEYAGGLLAEFEVALPAVIGVQAAHQPPRYAPVSRIRQIAKTAQIEAVAAEAGGPAGSPVRRMFKPEAAGHAEMWDGGPDEVAEKIAGLIAERGLAKS